MKRAKKADPAIAPKAMNTVPSGADDLQMFGLEAALGGVIVGVTQACVVVDVVAEIFGKLNTGMDEVASVVVVSAVVVSAAVVEVVNVGRVEESSLACNWCNVVVILDIVDIVNLAVFDLLL
ncbi:hypothetical protein WICPIJ_002029 [Wickerhamomyces pijperi]|uniref:Uncharacterized protein n=1 Tax=Wickerhamomyces pijperi TaxID=599730 RepID=A0A9P8TQ90_WICPI|nr:hypothetical protein WICPIJ_002029 [Wickerhamomyces pijperi]